MENPPGASEWYNDGNFDEFGRAKQSVACRLMLQDQGPKGRLHLLDGLRGLAAILVVIYHFNSVQLPMLQGAYLAVDFFFALSGLVLARAYEKRLRDNLSVAKFTEMRLLRMYPLYALGILIGVTMQMLKIVVHDPQAMSWQALARSASLAAMFLPDPFLNDNLFPLNVPHWSLFFELLVNIAFAVAILRLSTRWLVAIVLTALLTLAAGGMAHENINIGHNWETFAFGAVRAVGLFGLGVLCARIGHNAARRRTPATILLAVGFVAALCWRVPEESRFLLDLLLAAVATPALLLLGMRFEVPVRTEKFFSWLGDISFPIYATHAPLIICWNFVATRMGLPVSLEVIIFVALILAFGSLLVPLDSRVRKAMSQWLHLRRSAMPQAIG
ncbi:MAG: acyltransferase [Novosphingobium sp.]